jgi:hypothetical protein
MAKKCESRKKNGERCGADAQTANGLCVFHDPARAEDGHSARQAGGAHRSRPAAVLPSDTPDQPLGDTNQVSVLLADSINQLRRGQVVLRGVLRVVSSTVTVGTDSSFFHPVVGCFVCTNFGYWADLVQGT